MMRASADAGTGAIIPWRLRFPKDLRLIPRFETYPSVVSFAQTVLGKLLLMAIFGVGLWHSNPSWVPLITLLVLITAFPAYRRILVTFGALLWPFGISWRVATHSQLIDTALVLVFAGLMFDAAIRFPDSWFGRRPIVGFLGGFGISVFLVSYLPSGGRIHFELWQFLKVLSLYLWFIGYSLLDCTSKSRDHFALQLGTYQPFWMRGMVFSPIPCVKGARYLRRIEAKDSEQLAIAQIKGVKLLMWSFVLSLIWKALLRAVHGYLGIPTFPEVFASSVHRVPFPWFIGLASLISDFLEGLLYLSIVGHRIVACCRMAGFMALRNTYRPLRSRSIAEFWNRYLYYFKELLVDFFFYPTFMRYFKRWPRLRLFAATFAAACVGNVIFHFFLEMDSIEKFGFWKALAGFNVFIFYAVVLAAGIGISQLRQRQEKSGWIRGQLVPSFCAAGFFCILRVFTYSSMTQPIQEHFRFLAHLFNLNLFS
jgi:hypothetical protein